KRNNLPAEVRLPSPASDRDFLIPSGSILIASDNPVAILGTGNLCLHPVSPAGATLGNMELLSSPQHPQYPQLASMLTSITRSCAPSCESFWHERDHAKNSQTRPKIALIQYPESVLKRCKI